MSNTFVSVFYNLANNRFIIEIYIFLCKPIFYIVSSIMGGCSLQYMWYLYLSGIFWTSACLLIHILVFNQGLSHFPPKKIKKLSSVLRKYFIARYSFTSVHGMKKSKNLDGPPGCFPCNLITNLVPSPAIMPQDMVIFHLPPVSVMICNNFRILELDYLPI